MKVPFDSTYTIICQNMHVPNFENIFLIALLTTYYRLSNFENSCQKGFSVKVLQLQ